MDYFPGPRSYPIETENCLSKHPAVASAAVIGLPHEIWGEMVFAAVTLKPEAQATPDDLIDYCKSNIAGYKVPKQIRIWDGALPLNHTQKIDKVRLKALVMEMRVD